MEENGKPKVEGFLTLQELGKILKVSPSTVARLKRSGFPLFRNLIHVGRRNLISIKNFNEWATSSSNAQQGEEVKS